MTRRWPDLRPFVALCLSVFVLSCGGSDGGTGPGGNDDGDAIASVTVSPTSDVIDIDEQATFTATVRNGRNEDVTSTSTIVWNATPGGIVTVNGNGASAVVTGIGAGETTLRATAGGKTGQATVEVEDPNPPEAPGSVMASAVSDTEIVLAWSDNSNNEDGFQIDREEVTGGGGAGPARVFSEVTTVGANQENYRDSGLQPGKRYRYLIRACNENGCTPAPGSQDEDDATSNDVDTHETLLFLTESLPDGVVDQEYEAELESEGGDGSFDYSIAVGELPPGLAMSSDGVIDGTPTEAGTFDFTVEVLSGEQTVQVDFTVEISEEILPPQITTDELPSGVVGAAYSAQIEANRGDGASYAFAIVDGDLPDGLGMSASGAITGSPTTEESATFTVEVTSAEMTGEAELTIDVFEELEIGTSSLPSGVEGEAYNETLVATGGDGDVTWEVVDGDLPDGLQLSSNGTISGSVAAVAPPAGGGPAAVTGDFDFTVEAMSEDGQTAEADLSISIFELLEITTTSLPDGSVGVGYNATVVGTGGDTPYDWDDDGLPPGLTLNASSGAISGSPTLAGSYEVTITLTSDDGQVAEAEFEVDITGPPVITTSSLPSGTAGVAYNATLAATGGNGTYAWAITDGELPDNLSLNGSTGAITGTPVEVGTFEFTVEVTSDGQTDEADLSITISGGTPVSFARSFLPGAYPSVAYSGTFAAATGGVATITYSVTDGALPTGMSLSGRTISGSSSASGMHYFEITATDGSTEASVIFAITVSTNAAAGFNLFALNAAEQIPSAAIRTQINAVLARWEDVVTGDVAPIAVPGGFYGVGVCTEGQLLNGTTVDDVTVFIDIDEIDGSGDPDTGLNTLGFGGPCHGRGSAPSVTTFSGRLVLDVFDLGSMSDTRLFNLIWHELGHVMGVGTWWSTNGFLVGAGTATPTFTGPDGLVEYNVLLGGGAAVGIPVESSFGSGTNDAHWDEATFDTEIMTGISESGTQQISLMTIESLDDMGWTVAPGAADAYTLPGCSPTCPEPAPPGPGGRRPIDIVLQPLGYITPGGTVVRVSGGNEE